MIKRQLITGFKQHLDTYGMLDPKLLGSFSNCLITHVFGASLVSFLEDLNAIRQEVGLPISWSASEIRKDEIP